MSDQELKYWTVHPHHDHQMYRLKDEYLKVSAGGKLRFFTVTLLANRYTEGENRLLVGFDQTSGNGAPTIPIEAFLELNTVIERWQSMQETPQNDPT